MSDFTVSTSEYLALGMADPKALPRYIRDAQNKGRDFLLTGNPDCQELHFQKINGRIYFNRKEVEVLALEYLEAE